MEQLGLATLIVRDYDEAIAFYVDVLGFQAAEDVPVDDHRRRVVLVPSPESRTGILLVLAGTGARWARSSARAGRIGFVLCTEDFERDHRRLRKRGVRVTEPRHEPHGLIASFEDLYGNRWELLQPAAARPAAVAPRMSVEVVIDGALPADRDEVEKALDALDFLEVTGTGLDRCSLGVAAVEPIDPGTFLTEVARALARIGVSELAVLKTAAGDLRPVDLLLRS